MLIDNFQPEVVAGTLAVNPAPTTVTASFRIPDGGESIVFYNSGSQDVFVEFGLSSAVTAVVPSGATPGGYPIRAGAKENIRRPKVRPGDDLATWIATITPAAFTGNLYMTPGSGS
jgi:hypothetical protein